MADSMEVARLKELKPGIFVRNHIDNMGWIDSGDTVVVVDTLEQPHLKDEVFDLFDQTFHGRKAGIVINTHTHYDHVALNDDFADEHGAKIINLKTTEIPESGVTLDTQKEIQIIPFPRAHSHDDCVVWVPEDSVLFAGDLFGWGLIPWDGNLKPDKIVYIRHIYKTLIELEPEWVMPGHGPLATCETLSRWLTYFDDLCARMKQLVKQGGDQSDLMQIAPPEDMTDWWRFTQWKHEDTLKKVAKAATSGWLG
jgi:glyoxylase-like metal-dependent hydrolase (beta-lactamase superfamily II)